jgi:FtsP/CotA-like multicopper oxidase with cupredoxin domain
VEDDDELALGLPSGAYDVPLLLQDRRITPDRSFLYAPAMMDMMFGYLGDTILVNGVPDAEMPVAAAAYRFRLLNGSNARVFRLAFEDRRVFQVIASDGGLLDRPVPATEFYLSPGERAEIYVDLSRSQTNRRPRQVSLPFVGGGGTQGAPFTLLRFAVSGTGPTPPLPSKLVPVPDLGMTVIRRRFVMDMRMPPVMGNFWINGHTFTPGRSIAQVNRGVTEAWTVSNASGEPHPFHVHATQFKVLSRTSGPLGPHELGLKDTVLVWPGEIVQLAVRFDRHPGMFILHCHNLEHEDMGMMANFEIV